MAGREDDVARRELLASVASMYYLQELDQGAIAAVVGVSRSSVSRMITEARQAGVVHFRIDRPLPRAHDLELQVTAVFGVAGAVVVDDPAAGVTTPVAERVGVLGAQHLQERLPHRGVLAISWGEAVAAVAAALPQDSSRGVRVVQMIGASGTSRPDIDGPELAQTFALRLGGQHRTLNAPLVVDDPDLALALARQPSVAQVLREATGADVALVGLGSMEVRSSSLVRAGYVGRDELERCAALGVVGDVAGHMLGADGGLLASDLGARMVTLDEAALRAIPAVIAVAHGPAKVAIIGAALRSGLVDVLVSDARTVRAVLAGDAGTNEDSRSTSMKAAQYVGGARVEVRSVADRSPGPGEVLVRVASTTICGTDLRIASGAKSKGVHVPVVLGHETAGTVAQVGPGVAAVAVGMRVGMAPSVVCGHCDMCRRGASNLCRIARVLGHDLDGGLAEHLLVPRDAVDGGNLVVVSGSVPFEQVSLAEPLSCVVHAQTLFRVEVDDVVLVVGGGAIGLLHAQLARVSGARTVIVSEPVASRRDLAARLGVDVVVDPTAEDLGALVSRLTGGAGADVVVVCIGVPALVDQALALARFRGRVNFFAGFPKDRSSEIDPNRIHYGELTVTGSSNSTIDDYGAAIRLIESGRIDVGSLVTHRYPLDHVEDALAMAGSTAAIKVAVLPDA